MEKQNPFRAVWQELRGRGYQIEVTTAPDVYVYSFTARYQDVEAQELVNMAAGHGVRVRDVLMKHQADQIHVRVSMTVFNQVLPPPA